MDDPKIFHNVYFKICHNGEGLFWLTRMNVLLELPIVMITYFMEGLCLMVKEKKQLKEVKKKPAKTLKEKKAAKSAKKEGK